MDVCLKHDPINHSHHYTSIKERRTYPEDTHRTIFPIDNLSGKTSGSFCLSSINKEGNRRWEEKEE